jgi:hypothetical protein
MANAADELSKLRFVLVCHKGSRNEYGKLNIIIHQFIFLNNVWIVIIIVLAILGSYAMPDDDAFDVKSIGRKISDV